MTVVFYSGGYFDIVGEGHRQGELAQLAGPRSREGSRLNVDAELLPEDDNPHDPNAIKVLIEGVHVGYIARRDCRAFRKAFARFNPSGEPMYCSAQICGGWRDPATGDEGHYGVRLKLEWPLRARRVEE